MKKQMSRQEMFEKIQDLQRELADGAWENVTLSHHYSILKKRHNAVMDFISSNRFEVAVGMSVGADNYHFIAENVVNSLREEFKKIDEQFNES